MSRIASFSPQIDAIVVGAGFSGLYAIYRLRELGLDVRGFEAGNGVGGTWYWNRYLGARTDSEGYVYHYWFSDELLAEWDWSERFPGQAETERYLNHVADRFELRRHIAFNTRINAAHYDADRAVWRVTTASGETVTARFLVMCTGGLSAPTFPNIPGRDAFRGESYHTGQWPHAPVEFHGKRVGVIGTAATGIQVIQSIAAQVASLTVFQRTANYTIPMRNPRLDDAERARLRAHYPEWRHRVHDTFAGFHFDQMPQAFNDLDADERMRILENLWADGSLKLWIGSFREMFADASVNQVFSDFVRAKIRARVHDPRIAEKLLPKDHGFGTRRVPLETNYYEAFNRSNVELVDVRAEPIERITPSGLNTSAREYPLDMLVYATGFTAATGALSEVDVRGRGGVSLGEAWNHDVRTCLGMQVHGYPNLFMTMGPLSPAAAFCNVPTCIQQQVDWIRDAIAHVRARGCTVMEATAEAEAQWVEHADSLANMTLVPKTQSWYMSGKANGKPRLLPYAGGVNGYKRECDAAKARGYDGFAIR